MLVVWIAVLTVAAPVRAAFPPARKYVVDQAGVIGPAATADLQALLRDVEEQTTAEVAVVTVASLDGMSVEEYANGLFKAWGIGKKGVDNGVLVLVCPPEKKIRIEVGYGLEPVLPDGLAGSIVRTEFTPAFSAGDYSRGILAGVGRVAAIVREHHVLSPEERSTLGQASLPSNLPSSYLTTPFFGLFVALGCFVFGLGARKRAFFPLLWGAAFGGVPFAMALIPALNASVWTLGVLGIVMLVLGYATAGHVKSVKTRRGPSIGNGSSSDSTTDDRTSSSDTSSSSSDDSDSFGGGESGGGGASGSW
jgi:uncharacterized protein